MPLFNFDGLNSEQGTNTANGLRNVANAAADLVCDMYQNAPTGVVPSFGDGIGIGAFTQGMLDSLCRPRGKEPPPPARPFEGGQCSGVLYNVNVTYKSLEFAETTTVIQAMGPIGPAVETTVDDPPFTRFTVKFSSGGGPISIIQGATKPGFGRINSVTRADGGTDNCGSPPIAYPTRPPVASDYQRTSPVGFGGPTVNVPVVIIPTLIKPEFNFRPEINVNVGGLTVNITPDGIDVFLPPNPVLPTPIPPGGDVPSPIIDPRPTPPPAIPPRGQPVQCPELDLTEVLEKLEDIEECACDGDFTIETIEYGLAKGRTLVLPSGSFYVKVSISVTPSVRYQVAEGDAPDVYYAGWYSFGSLGSHGLRSPISFAASGFFVPDGATTFSYSLVFNSTATVTIYRRIPV